MAWAVGVKDGRQAAVLRRAASLRPAAHAITLDQLRAAAAPGSPEAGRTVRARPERRSWFARSPSTARSKPRKRIAQSPSSRGANATVSPRSASLRYSGWSRQTT